MRTAAVCVAVLLAACGGGDDDDPLADAEAAMAGLQAGRIELQLSATAGGEEPTGPVGFRVEGPFSFEGDGELAVVDLAFTRLLGDEELATQVVSTGDAMYVVTDGEVVELTPEARAELRLGDGEGGVADLGIAGWVRDPRVDGRTVTGEVDVADFLTDLARIGEGLGGAPAAGGLDDDVAERLDALARSSSVEIELAEDDLPTSIQLDVDFGGEVPDELREALGPYASAHLALTVTLERLTEPLVVAAPTG
jgi:hypothetical protein